MTTKIKQFYSKHYDKMIKFACNAHGRGLQMEKEDAEDLISSIFTYYLRHPDKYDGKWVWNTIIQRRVNFHRERDKRERAMSSYKVHIQQEDRLPEEEEVVDTVDIKQHILHVQDLVTREVLTRHFILGESTAEAVRNVKDSSRMMIHRFNLSMIKKGVTLLD